MKCEIGHNSAVTDQMDSEFALEKISTANWNNVDYLWSDQFLGNKSGAIGCELLKNYAMLGVGTFRKVQPKRPRLKKLVQLF